MTQVVIIGSGNVATSLAHGLAACCTVAQIYSRTLANAQELADAINCANATNDLNELIPNADAYIVAVSDDAISSVIRAVPDNGALWIHTSGSTPISLFDGLRSRYGVLWPMQSFSREMVTQLDEVHFFAEASDEHALMDVMQLGYMLSSHVIAADSNQRRWLHIASVFSCNFANHMWTLADELLTSHGLPFEALKPLVRTTVEKLDRLSPARSQTGPAVRHDMQVIENHLALLEGDTRDIYQLLTDSIINRNSKDKNAE